MMGERGWKGGVFNPPPQLFSAGVAVLAALSRLTSRCFKFIYLFGDNLFGVRGIIKGRNTLFSIATGGDRTRINQVAPDQLRGDNICQNGG
ncbi:hypothetical protein ETAR_09820 [Edwardsiella tarda]